MRISHTLCYMALVVFAFAVNGSEAIGRLTREDIIENHARRKKQIAKMLEDTEQTLSDHESGVRRLEAEEHATMSKRATLYKRKLESMTDELDEKEINRMMDRERMRAERYEKREL